VSTSFNSVHIVRTNIDIDDGLMEKAMQAGPYKTKKDAVEAGLKLLARQAAYREIVKWRGKLKWEGDESADWTKPIDEPEPGALPPAQPARAPLVAAEPAPPAWAVKRPTSGKAGRARR
jgi:Arc/MetJ family transcription regulator